MNEEKKLLSAEAADRLLACADGTAALLYLHILRSGTFSLTAASRVLKRSETEIALAADSLRRLGLMERREAPLPEKEMPEYTTEDIVSRAGTDNAFAGIAAEAERALGRVLSSNDLRLLFGIYDHLGLPAEVIMVLLHHCIEEYQARSGAGRMPTMRYIEKEGWYWAEQEIMDLDAAEEHIRREKQKAEALEQVKEVLQIRGRELTATERRYAESWLNLGYEPEALAIAYDRTVSSTGKLAWKYMDSIVRSWNEKRLYTPEEIEAGDSRRYASRKAPVQKTDKSDDEKIAQMRKMYHQMKTGEG